MGDNVGQKYRHYRSYSLNLAKRIFVGDRSLINEVEKNSNSNSALQQNIRNELNLQKTSTGKRTIEDMTIEERRLKLLKTQSHIDQINAETKKIKAETEKIKTETEELRIQAKNSYQDWVKFLSQEANREQSVATD